MSLQEIEIKKETNKVPERKYIISSDGKLLEKGRMNDGYLFFKDFIATIPEEARAILTDLTKCYPKDQRKEAFRQLVMKYCEMFHVVEFVHAHHLRYWPDEEKCIAKAKELQQTLSDDWLPVVIAEYQERHKKP